MAEKKAIFIVLDGVGIGALPDALLYGDQGTNTLANTAEAVGGLNVPTLERLGLGNIVPLKNVKSLEHPIGCYGKLGELSKGKDSTTGHWEISGIITTKAFPTYPHGFPPELIENFKKVTKCEGILGNKPASGTVIIQEHGEEHLRTGYPIVYTSGDSVFQIAAHEEMIPVPKLYEMCKRTRGQVCVGEHAVGRVIARPFIGTSAGKFTRTPNRKDFAVEPSGTTVLDLLTEEGVDTIAIGKIDDLFSGRGLREKIHTKSNAEGIEKIILEGKRLKSGFLMANLVDFDMLYGHRQDPKGFAQALEYFDSRLPRILETLGDGDLLMITGDHGNDPTDSSTDHSREYVPILCFCKNGKHGMNIGTRKTFADAGKTVANFFGLNTSKSSVLAGESFLNLIM